MTFTPPDRSGSGVGSAAADAAEGDGEGAADLTEDVKLVTLGSPLAARPSLMESLVKLLLSAAGSAVAISDTTVTDAASSLRFDVLSSPLRRDSVTDTILTSSTATRAEAATAATKSACFATKSALLIGIFTVSSTTDCTAASLDGIAAGAGVGLASVGAGVVTDAVAVCTTSAPPVDCMIEVETSAVTPAPRDGSEEGDVAGAGVVTKVDCSTQDPGKLPPHPDLTPVLQLAHAKHSPEPAEDLNLPDSQATQEPANVPEHPLR